MRHDELKGVMRWIPVAHGEAFQLMRYTAEGGPDLWIWNSRDGVTPFGTGHGGFDYRHAMNSYRPTHTAILPDEAQFVWVDYDRAAWEDMQRRRYDMVAGLPDGPYTGAGFRVDYPTAEAWLAVAPFEAGQPRLLTREEWLLWTPSYAGRPPKPETTAEPVEQRPDFVAWEGSGFPDGAIVEVRERNGHEHPMKVGSIQFKNALRELGSRMPVRAATAEQRKGWEPQS
jgi:hypothetical protein